MRAIRSKFFALPAAGLLLGGLLQPALALAQEGKARGPWNFNLRAETEVTYDDNIISLSDTQKAQLKDPAFANSDLFRITTADDVIVSPELALQFDRVPRGGPATNILLTLRDNEYTTNVIKTYQQYSLALRQELHRNRAHSTALTIGGTYIPSYYLRQLIDQDASAIAGTTIHSSADYSLNETFIEVSQELVDRTMSIAARYARENRSYRDPFKNRDSISDVTFLEVDIFPMQRTSFRLRPYFGHEQRSAQGDLPSTTVVEDDPGFHSDTYGLDLRWLWGPNADHRGIFRVWDEKEDRNFTSNNSADINHFGRTDAITQYGIDYDRGLGPDWKLRFAYRHRLNDVSLPLALGGPNTTPFEKNVVSTMLVYRFDQRSRQGKKRP